MAPRQPNPRHLRSPTSISPSTLLLALLSTPWLANAQNCISLSGSTTCPAFNTSVISTNAQLREFFPFLANVSSVQTFDTELRSYVSGAYVSSKYRGTFGCQNVNLNNTIDLYARYTTSYLCNAIVQNSLTPCDVRSNTAPPLCADTCGDFAQSEQEIVSSPELCQTTNANINSLLRADFTNCALPAESINNQCIHGAQNEPANCGYQNNLAGLCSFCATSTVNSTDSCCVTARAESRCRNVRLPVFSSAPSMFTATSASSAAPSATSAANITAAAVSDTSRGLSGGAIAGIVIGSVLGAALLLALLVFGCVFLRRSQGAAAANKGSFLNQPTPPRSGETLPAAVAAGLPSSHSKEQKFDPIPGARVTRMTALEGPSETNSPGNIDGSPAGDTAYGETAIAGVRHGEKYGWKTPSEGIDGGNLSSSPESLSTAEGTGRSEQMDQFKDYYSEDEIQPGNLVSTLWAYQPRAGDEHELERGDMLRIVGIWDDGWATGVRVNLRAEDWDPERNTQRDSGFSTQERTSDSPPTNGHVKAFPLVCVCLPQHWSKIIENEVEDGTNQDGDGR